MDSRWYSAATAMVLVVSMSCAPPPLSKPRIDLPVNEEEVLTIPFAGDANFDLPLRSPEPIPTAPDRRTIADLDRELARHLDAIAQSHAAANRDRGDAKRLGEELLRAWIALEATHPVIATKRRSGLAELARRVSAAEPEDPTVRALLLMQRLDIGDGTATTELRELYPRLREDANVSHYCRVQAAHWLVVRAWEESMPGRVEGQQMRDAVLDWVKQLGADPTALRLFWRKYSIYLEACAKKGQLEEPKRILDGVVATPGVDPWLAHLMAGAYYRTLAWQRRGGSTAAHVTPEGWEKFERFLQLAARHLTWAWQLRPDMPQAPTEMISVAMGGGDERHTAREWFDRAIQAVVDWPTAYSYYVYSLYPRWGGGAEEMMAFGRECAETRRFDTDIPLYLHRVVTTIHDEADGDPEILDRPGTYASLAPMYRGYLDSEQGPPEWRWTAASCWGVWAARLGHFADARRAMDAVDDETFRANIESAEKYSLWRSLAFAATGPAAEPVGKLAQHHPFGKVVDAEAVARMKEWLAEARRLDPSPPAARYFHELDTVLGWRATFLAGDWVSLQFNEEIWGWKLEGRGAERIVENDESIRLSTRTSRLGGMRIESLLPFEPPFVLELELAQVPPITEPTIGVHVGESMKFGGSGRYFCIDQQGGAAGRIVFGERDLGGFLQLRPTNHIRLKMWSGHFEYSVNDAFFYDAAEENLDSNGRLSFGDYQASSPPAEARFAKIRIRRLPYGPPPAKTDELREYARRAIAFDPGDSFAHLAFATTTLPTGDLSAEVSVKALERLIDRQDWLTGGVVRMQGLLAMARGEYAAARDQFALAMSHPNQAPLAAPYMSLLLSSSPDAAVRDGAKARELADQCHATPGLDQWWIDSIVAAAHAEIGDFDFAIALQSTVVEAAPADQRAEHEKLLQNYREHKPYRLSFPVPGPPAKAEK